MRGREKASEQKSPAKAAVPMRTAAFFVPSAQLKERTMKNRLVDREERQFITKEFADALAGKQPHPYLRLQDPVLKTLVDTAQAPYIDPMIHFWREISLAGMEISGRGMNECYALLFESAFDLALAEQEWAAKIFAETHTSNHRFNNLQQLNHQLCRPLTHESLVDAFRRCYAPLREEETRWQNSVYVAIIGDVWFWGAITCAAGIDENHPGWGFRCDLVAASSNGWFDGNRPHVRLIREAPRLATATPRDQLMAHPLLRIARLKYHEGCVEQKLVLKFLNARCIKEGFSSEEDSFASDLTLARWVRDARRWAEELLEYDPESCNTMFEEDTEESIQSVRALFRRELGPDPARVDDLEATDALIKWAKRLRGFEFSQYRAQLWEFVVIVVDAALWLGWMFPRTSADGFVPRPG
jgi:hypothetical protein